MFRLAYVIAYRRIASNWKLELAVALGILLAVAIVAGGVIYSAVLEEAALQRTLTDSTDEEVNLEVRYFYNMNLKFHQDAENLITERVQPIVEEYYGDQAQWVRTSTFYFEGYSNLELAQQIRPRGRLQYITGYEDHVSVIEGRLPLSSGEPVELAVDTLALDLLGLSIGDEVDLVPAVGGDDSKSLRAKLVGRIQITDRNESFWYGASDALSYVGSNWSWIPMFTQPASILQTLANRYPGMYTEESWFFYLDRPNLRTSEIRGLQDALEDLTTDIGLNLENSSVQTHLTRILYDYKQQVTLARVPLLLLVILSIAILMYYLFMVSSLIIRSRGVEIAVLKSRGATTLQVTLLMFVEGLIMAVPAIALGPFLALGIVTTLGDVLAAESPEIGLVPVALSPRAFLLGASGGILSVAMLSISALVTARHGVVQFRQMGARPPSVPFLHRYYVDFMLLGIIGFIYWQLQENESFLVRELGESQLSIDYSLLIGPILLLVAVGLMVLRFFPWILRGLSRAAEGMNVVWPVQALRRISRDPIIPGALVVLVMLATALGVVASTFSASLQGSQEDRALYSAGADVRVKFQIGRTTPPVYGNGQGIDFGEEVEAASLIYRQGASLTTSGFGREVTLMAIDTETFADTAWYRDDLSSQSLDEMMSKIRPKSSLDKGLELPANATEVGVWVRPVRPDSRTGLIIRLQDDAGQFFSVWLSRLDEPVDDDGFLPYTLNFRDWRYMSAYLDLDAENAGLPIDPIPPFTLRGLFIDHTFGNEAGALFIDDVSVTTPEGLIVLDEFEDELDWRAIEDPTAPGLISMDTSHSVFHSGVASASITWSSGGLGTRGVIAAAPPSSLPAITNKNLLKIGEAKEGDTLVVRINSVPLPIEVVDAEDFIPTLFATSEDFVLVDLESLLDYVNLRMPRSPSKPNELWVSISPGADSSVVTTPLQVAGVKVLEVTEASSEVESRQSHPLLSTGWSGLLVLSFISVVLASASSVMLYSFMDAKEHQTEFALVRAFGLSRQQLNGILWFGLSLIVLTAILVGTGVGFWFAQNLLPLMERAEEGQRITPPMALRTDWLTLVWYYLVLAGAGIVTSVMLALVVSKLQVHKVLRIGEQ